jgi:hypothetical protein
MYADTLFNTNSNNAKSFLDYIIKANGLTIL